MFNVLPADRVSRPRTARYQLLLTAALLAALIWPASVQAASPHADGAASRVFTERGRGKALADGPDGVPPGTPFYPATLLRTFLTSTWTTPAPDPSGMDYWPAAGKLVITDSEVEESVNGNPPAYWNGYNVFFSSLSGGLTGNCTTYTSTPAKLLWNDFTDEPAGFAINTDNGKFYFSSDGPGSRVHELSFGPDGIYCTADDVVRRISIAQIYGTTDAEDVAYGNNTLFISDGTNAEVYAIPLGADGLLDTPDDGAFTHFDTAAMGFNDLEGIGYNADRGTLFIVSTVGAENYLGEVSVTGTLLRAYDLSFMGTAYNMRSDVVWAPSSADPNVKSLYIASRGIDNNPSPQENDGKIWEISLGSPAGGFDKLSPQDGFGSQPTNPVLSWSASPGAVEYEYCIDQTNDDACTGWVNNGLATSVSLSGLTSARTYYWQARAVGGGTYTYADGSPSAYNAFTTVNYLFPPWFGSASITSNRPVVTVARPHVGAEVASYDGLSGGGQTVYLPMLFKQAFGGLYDSAFYVQNTDAVNPANLSIKFYDSAGTLTCTLPDEVAPLASKGWWLPSVACLPAGWVGGAVVTADRNIAAVGRPHVGAEVMNYNAFTAGSGSSNLPMLFKKAFGGSYDSAFYVQNVDPVNTAQITIKYYDSGGALTCSTTDSLAPLASKGWWLPSVACLPAGWVGGAVVTADTNIVSIGRVHVGTQITSYGGFSIGSGTMFVPMLFKRAFGGAYNAAFYVQNLDAAHTANLTIKFYDSAGNLTCSLPATVAPLASRGWWAPELSCLPDGWVGGAAVTSDWPIAAIGRPHVGGQVTAYAGIPAGSGSQYLPMLFSHAFDGTYDAAFYVQNTDTSNAADVTIQFYDSAGNLSCVRTDTVPAKATLGYWLPTVTCNS